MKIQNKGSIKIVKQFPKNDRNLSRRKNLPMAKAEFHDNKLAFHAT